MLFICTYTSDGKQHVSNSGHELNRECKLTHKINSTRLDSNAVCNIAIDGDRSKHDSCSDNLFEMTSINIGSKVSILLQQGGHHILNIGIFTLHHDQEKFL